MRLVLVALLACVHTRASPLTKSAASFKACAVGKGDVDVSAFADATLAYCALLRRFGVFTAGSIRQVLLCIDKVEEARKSLIGAASKGSRSKMRKMTRSMRALLESELEKAIHGKGGLLADPSAAMGLLWVRRGLMFWARLFDLEARRLMDNHFRLGEPGTFMAQTTLAYDKEISDFHGWVARKAFLMSVRAAPEWDVLCERAGLPSDGKQLAEELRSWAKVLDGLDKRMRTLHTKYDLDDRRRTI